MMSKSKAVGSKAEDFESVRSKVVLMFFNAVFLSEENNVYKPFEDDQRNKMGDTRSYNLLECQYLSFQKRIDVGNIGDLTWRRDPGETCTRLFILLKLELVILTLKRPLYYLRFLFMFPEKYKGGQYW